MKPQELHLAPDGKDTEPENASSGLGMPDSPRETAIEEQWTMKKALRSPSYWALYFAFFFGGTFMIVDMHQIASLVDKGIDKSTASLVFAGAGLMHTIGVLVGGVASDRIGSRRSFALGAASLIAGVVSLLHIQAPSPTLSLLVFILLYGFGKGFRTALMPLIAAEVFHGERVGTIYGSLATAITFGGVAGPWLAGILHDRTGDYWIAFSLVIISTAVSCVLVWMAPPPRGVSATK
jgi:MFS family permease